jgi:hypothetical protein
VVSFLQVSRLRLYTHFSSFPCVITCLSHIIILDFVEEYKFEGLHSSSSVLCVIVIELFNIMNAATF